MTLTENKAVECLRLALEMRNSVTGYNARAMMGLVDAKPLMRLCALPKVSEMMIKDALADVIMAAEKVVETHP
jgi:hypothetical protein